MQFVSKSKFDYAYYALVPYHWHVGIRRYVEKRLPGLKYVRWKRMEHRSRILNAFTMKARTACAGRLCGRHCVSMLTRNLHVSPVHLWPNPPMRRDHTILTHQPKKERVNLYVMCACDDGVNIFTLMWLH